MRSPLLPVALVITMSLAPCVGKTQQPASGEGITQGIRGLRQLPETQRGVRVGELARQIAALPPGADKLKLADGLAHLATEGDPGHDNLQAVTDALAQALTVTPAPFQNGKVAPPSNELAILQRYEGMHVAGAIAADPQYKAAADLLVTQDEQASTLNFTLKDINGKTWTKDDLHGRVVVLNFWATWCPPCRQELPNLDALAAHYAPQGLVVLAITSEDANKVHALLRNTTPHFNIMLDTGNKVGNAFQVQSLPRTLVFDRQGKLAAVAMDARTQRQFLLMLRSAGLQ